MAGIAACCLRPALYNAAMKSIASHNGLAATQLVHARLAAGKSRIEALLEGIELVEDDPNEHTVGYGGLPNENGTVELDAAIMDGPTHRGAGVAALQGVRHPTRLAYLLSQQTGRALLVGEGAKQFARDNGIPDENLLTEQARRMWLYWKRKRGSEHDWQPPPAEDDHLHVEHYYKRHFNPPGGTVHVAAQDVNGDLSCATSTSGHAFKMPGRVGDSPILGAGLYVDNAVGTCGSIGHGEANLQNCSSFAAVELMRNGRPPREAGLEVLRRIVASTVPALRDAQGRPRFNLQLFLLARNGTHAGVSLWGPKNISVTDSAGTRWEPCASLFEGKA